MTLSIFALEHKPQSIGTRVFQSWLSHDTWRGKQDLVLEIAIREDESLDGRDEGLLRGRRKGVEVEKVRDQWVQVDLCQKIFIGARNS